MVVFYVFCKDVSNGIIVACRVGCHSFSGLLNDAEYFPIWPTHNIIYPDAIIVAFCHTQSKDHQGCLFNCSTVNIDTEECSV
jgi:hypothetical protein